MDQTVKIEMIEKKIVLIVRAGNCWFEANQGSIFPLRSGGAR